MMTTHLLATTRRSSLQAVIAFGLFAFAGMASADLTFNYNFAIGTNVPDYNPPTSNGQLTDMRTLGGLSSFSNVTVRLNLSSPDGNNPMVLGDMYSTLTRGAGESTAVLINRPGVSNTDGVGSLLSSFNVTLDDTAPHNVYYASSYYPTETTLQSDGRLGVDPYGDAVPYSSGDRTNTLSHIEFGNEQSIYATHGGHLTRGAGQIK